MAGFHLTDTENQAFSKNYETNSSYLLAL